MGEKEPTLDVVDVGGSDGVRRRMQVKLQGEPEPVWQEQDNPVPEERMDEINELLGDGAATVTVGLELKTAANFDSAGASVYVKLTCNQDNETINKTHALATELAEEYLGEGYIRANNMLAAVRAKDQQPKAFTKKKGGAAPAKAKPATSKKAPVKKKTLAKAPAKKTGPARKKVGTSKPSFRRK